MKQKFTITRDSEKNELVIQEYSEIDKSIFALLYDDTFDIETIANARNEGNEAIKRIIYTDNFFPNEFCSEKIIQGVLDLLNDSQKDVVEFIVDDAEFLARMEEEKIPDETEDTPDIDDLLEDDAESEVEDHLAVKKLSSSLKVDDVDPDNPQGP